MTASILQEVQTSGSASVSSLSAAFGSSVTAGSTLHNLGNQTTDNTVTYTFSDNNQGSQTYTQLDSYWEPNNGSGYVHAYIPNHPAGATTGQVGFSVAGGFRAAWFREVGGVSTTAPLDAHSTFTSHTSTTLTTTLSNTNQPALISAWAAVSGNAAATPTATTGTQGIQGWAYPPSGSINSAVSSSQRLTATGSNTITFGITTATGIDLVGMAAIFDEPTSLTAIPPAGSQSLSGGAPTPIQGAVVTPAVARPYEPCARDPVRRPSRKITLPVLNPRPAVSPQLHA